MKSTYQVIFNLMIVVIISIGLIMSGGWPSSTALFPRAIGFPVLALSLVTFAVGVFDLRRGRGRGASDESSSFEWNSIAGTIRIFGWLVGFAVAIWAFGFELSVPLFVFLYTKLQGNLSWLTCILVTASATAFVLIVFGLVFNITWPTGVVLEVLQD